MRNALEHSDTGIVISNPNWGKDVYQGTLFVWAYVGKTL
jgi:hypothetical protein